MSQISQEIICNTITTKSFLKWVGSKEWLKKEIAHLVRKSGKLNYVEPFLGSGAVFFSNNFNSSVLNDINSELIQTFICVKDRPEELFNSIKLIPQNEEAFYSLRKQSPVDSLEIATRFIYLNKTSFNGLYRVNRNGEFNASYGKRTFSLNQLKESLFSCSKKLEGVKLINSNFTSTIDYVDSNSIVFLDPPYIHSTNSGFNKYDKNAFSDFDNIELYNFIKVAKERGAKYILTNEDNEQVRQIFSGLEDNLITASRTSNISSKVESRKKYNELIVTNIDL